MSRVITGDKVGHMDIEEGRMSTEGLAKYCIYIMVLCLSYLACKVSPTPVIVAERLFRTQSQTVCVSFSHISVAPLTQRNRVLDYHHQDGAISICPGYTVFVHTQHVPRKYARCLLAQRAQA